MYRLTGEATTLPSFILHCVVLNIEDASARSGCSFRGNANTLDQVEEETFSSSKSEGDSVCSNTLGACLDITFVGLIRVPCKSVWTRFPSAQSEVLPISPDAGLMPIGSLNYRQQALFERQERLWLLLLTHFYLF